MTELFQWPALRSDGYDLPAFVDYQCAVWGKVHGAPTDFRWIAQSDDFGRDRPDVQPQLSLGGEDVAARLQSWRNLGDRCYAVGAYPSRAIDAAGRRGFLEKQILEWRVPAGVPPILGALLLLPHVAAMTDAIWWDRAAGDVWAPLEIHLPILAADHEPLAVEQNGLDAAIDRGRRALREAVELPTLRTFYDQILAGGRPAFLIGLLQPLPPEALAALLLPLPREIADHISIAGWIPTSRPALTDLATRWDVMVIPPDLSVPPMVSAPGEEAERMARQLLDDDPVFLRPRTAPKPVAATRPIKIRREGPPRPGMKLDLAPPEPNAPAILHTLHDFALAVDRRWLTPSDLRNSGGAPPFANDEVAADLLCDWVREVKEQQPPHADERQWQVKVDLLRSAAFALAPRQQTLRVDLPESDSCVPAFFFGLLIDRNHCDALFKLGERPLNELVNQTLVCSLSGEWDEKLRRWLEQWGAVSGNQKARDLIGSALKSHPRP
jgi:hypothetical protein